MLSNTLGSIIQIQRSFNRLDFSVVSLYGPCLLNLCIPPACISVPDTKNGQMNE